MLKALRVITWRWDTYILKAFSGRFGFDGLRISQIQTVSQNQSNGNAPKYVIIVPISIVGYGIYIGVGLSALLGSTNRAMREPLDRGPGTELSPRIYLYDEININNPSLGDAWSKKYNNMKVYKEWLQRNGYRFQEEEFGLTFKYQGANFIIFNPGNDNLFFQLVMPGIYDVQPGEKVKVLEIANSITREVKCLKCVVQDGGSVWLMTEIFIDTTPELDDFMERLLGILHEGRFRFYSKMQ